MKKSVLIIHLLSSVVTILGFLNTIDMGIVEFIRENTGAILLITGAVLFVIGYIMNQHDKNKNFANTINTLSNQNNSLLRKIDDLANLTNNRLNKLEGN